MNPEQTLARWRAEESEVRERLAERAGYVRAEQLDGRSGLQTLRAIFAGELSPPPMGDTLGFVPIRIEHGLAVFQGKPDFRYYNPLGTVHGGWFAAHVNQLPSSDATVVQRVEWRVCGSLCDTSGRPFRAYLYLSTIISEAPHCAHFRVYRGEQALLTKHIRRGVYSAPRALPNGRKKRIRGDDQWTRGRPSCLHQRCPWW